MLYRFPWWLHIWNDCLIGRDHGTYKELVDLFKKNKQYLRDLQIIILIIFQFS